ncbi:isochorismatase family protein [Microbacterium murale]|uniref:Nicotinamidase-related amidase n=1 Tax=Microbacterium murale TaxID=1081040 RepID=A0ABU0P7A0_9MICO|nr:isochorismatase family protein [Microbacterium murale]MDQ0642772.1 nicotinamidase-related amidase [Microbacterium murale]
MPAPRRALVVIDPQQEYFTGLLRIQYPPREESIQRIAYAINAAEQAGIPVVMVQHTAGDDAPVFNPTTPQFRLHASLEDRDSNAWKKIVKNHSSVFPGTGLHEWLVEAHIDTITLVGYMTNNCVLATAADAETRGITVEVIADATGAIDIANDAGSVDAETVHTTLMALLNSNWAAVAPAATWVEALETGTPLRKGNLPESAARGASAHA